VTTTFQALFGVFLPLAAPAAARGAGEKWCKHAKIAGNDSACRCRVGKAGANDNGIGFQ
jgi:hypothetical protein